MKTYLLTAIQRPTPLEAMSYIMGTAGKEGTDKETNDIAILAGSLVSTRQKLSKLEIPNLEL